MHERIWVQGKPATFATKSERPWKDQILAQMDGSINQFDSLDLEFRLPESAFFMDGYDLDNLCDPVFTVLTSELGWYGRKQTNIRSWRAVKKQDNTFELWIKQTQDMEVSIDPSSVIFDAKYDDKLPRGSRDPEIPNWLFNLGEVPRVYGVCGLALIFININRSIASLSDGLVKHVIDCLYPILGGRPGAPEDHKIAELIVKREETNEDSETIRIIVWSDPKECAANVRLVERVEHLINELRIINELFDAYETLYNKQATDLDVLNRTPGFFQLNLYSFINQFAIMLSRMYDSHDNTNSLMGLCKLADKNQNYLPLRRIEYQNTIANCQSLVSEQADKVKQLKVLRDRLLAHNDIRTMNMDVWKEAGLTIGDYRLLVSVAHEIICMCSNLVDIPTPMLGMGVKTEIDYLITTLKKKERR